MSSFGSSAMGPESIRTRRESNTSAQTTLPPVSLYPNNHTMASKKARLSRFGELVQVAAKGFPELWKENGELNLAAVAALYSKRGYPIPQPTLWRNCFLDKRGSVQHPKETTIEATYSVLGIPREMLRGESVSRRLEDLLSRYPLEVLLLAQRIVSLQDEDRDDILRQVGRMEERAVVLRNALQHGNVTPITKHRD
jgi:hypothetical protein